jgi:hypothetical protein
MENTFSSTTQTEFLKNHQYTASIKQILQYAKYATSRTLFNKKLKNHLVSNPTCAKSAVLPLEAQKNISAFI